MNLENTEDWHTWRGKSTFKKYIIKINLKVFVGAAEIVMISHFRRLPIRE